MHRLCWVFVAMCGLSQVVSGRRRGNGSLLSLSIRTVPTELVLSVGTPNEISFLTKKSVVKMFEKLALVVTDQSTWTILFWPPYVYF